MLNNDQLEIRQEEFENFLNLTERQLYIQNTYYAGETVLDDARRRVVN